jgi:hypothetical protein
MNGYDFQPEAIEDRSSLMKSRHIMYLVLVSLSMTIAATAFPARNATANQLNIIDWDNEGIAAGETQYFAIYNDAANTSMVLNMTTLEFDGNLTSFPNMTLSVFAWNAYFPGTTSGALATNFSNKYSNRVSFTCTFHQRYLVRIENIDPADDATYNLTVITDPGVSIHNQVGFIEQGVATGKIRIGYYQDTDPWLYDSYDDEYRSTIQVGYFGLGAQSYVNPSGERYFTIQNLYANVTLFVGMTSYTLDPSGIGDANTLGVSDWAVMDTGSTDWIDLAYNFFNYSAGFNFTCEKDHTYQVYFKNGDSAYGLFLNMTFYAWGQARIRYDYDLDAEPPTDQIRVRAFSYDPWLDYRAQSRNLMYGWIAGGASIGVLGTFATLYFIKRRYR